MASALKNSIITIKVACTYTTFFKYTTYYLLFNPIHLFFFNFIDLYLYVLFYCIEIHTHKAFLDLSLYPVSDRH